MKFGFFIVAICVTLGWCGEVNSQNYDSATKVIDSVLNNYDKRLRPNYGGPPTDVSVTMFIISVSAISDANLDYTIDFYFREFWNDPRLAFAKNTTHESIAFGHELGKQIWIPDLFFVAEKSSFLHTTTTRNEFVKIDALGNVTRSIRLSVTAGCNMNFRAFPFDTQLCTLDIESYASNAKGIKLHWKELDSSVGVADDLMITNFLFAGHKEHIADVVLASATYSRLRVDFEFLRLKGHYMRQIFIPLTMLVIISWMSFFINQGAHHARLAVVSLSLFSMIILCNLVESPETDYTKALDIFTGVSMTFAFVAFAIFLYVNNNSSDNNKDSTTKVDKLCQLAYPALFVIFNGIYWTIY